MVSIIAIQRMGGDIEVLKYNVEDPSQNELNPDLDAGEPIQYVKELSGCLVKLGYAA